MHHIKRSKAKELGAIRPQRPNFFWLGKIFFFGFLHELGYSDSFDKISFFGLFWPCGLYEGHKAKNFHCLQNNFLFSNVSEGYILEFGVDSSRSLLIPLFKIDF